MYSQKANPATFTKIVYQGDNTFITGVWTSKMRIRLRWWLLTWQWWPGNKRCRTDHLLARLWLWLHSLSLKSHQKEHVTRRHLELSTEDYGIIKLADFKSYARAILLSVEPTKNQSPGSNSKKKTLWIIVQANKTQAQSRVEIFS